MIYISQSGYMSNKTSKRLRMIKDYARGNYKRLRLGYYVY